MSSMASSWKIYRTRFLIKAKQLDAPLVFTDPLGREHCGARGDYLVESSDGLQRIAPREIFEDIYVPMGLAGDSWPSPLPDLDLHSQPSVHESCPVRESHPVRSQPLPPQDPLQPRQSAQVRPPLPQRPQAQPHPVQQHRMQQHRPSRQNHQLRQPYPQQQPQPLYQSQTSQSSRDPQLSPRRSAVNRTFVA